MKSYVIHLLRAMPSQGALEGRYVGRAQSPLPMGAVAELAEFKREYKYPQGELYCASPAVSCVDTLKILYPQASLRWCWTWRSATSGTGRIRRRRS